MALGTLQDRQNASYVESPSRANGSAVEVTNDAAETLLTSIDSKVGQIGTAVFNSIESNAFNLNSAAFNQTSNITNDYILDHIELNFSTSQIRDISIVLSNGTKLYESLSDTSLNIVIDEINLAFNADDNFTIQITQTAGACSLDVLAVTRQGEAVLTSTGSVIQGVNDAGQRVDLAATAEGHLEVALHGPRLPFGSVHVESLAPIFQADAVYGANLGQNTLTTSGSGTAGADDSSFVVTTGTTIYSQGSLQSRKRLRYRAGQGVVGRFTAIYTSPVASSYQVAGFGHSEDGVYFGYKNTDFGILYSRRGVRAVYSLTVTVGASSASNATVELNGVSTVVALTAASNVQRTVYELSRATYTGWKAYPQDGKVIFVKDAVGATAGAFSYSAGTTGSAASIAQTKAGAAATETFITQESWNGDKLDGTGASGITADWTKYNVFQIGIQYLGAGAITFYVEVAHDGNNPDFVVVHNLKLPNTIIASSFGNPSFPFTMAVYSSGSTTNLTVKCASYGGFIEGAKHLHGNRFSYFNATTSVGAAAYFPLFTILNKRYYNGKSNQAVINLLSVSGAVKHTQPVVYYLVSNGTLTGNPNFQDLSSLSCSAWDTAATGVTWANGEQLLWTGHLGETGELDHHFGNGSFNAEEITLQPGEYVTLAVRSVQNNVAHATGAINTREDQ
jgi:hypothetical protein